MRTFAFITVAICTWGHASTAFAQTGDLGALLTPYFMQPREKYELKLRGSYFQDGEDEFAGNRWESYEGQVNFRYTIKRTPETQIYYAIDTYRLSMQNQARFSATGVEVPDQFADVGTGISFRKTVNDNWNVGGTFRVGSASDKLFNSLDEMYLSGTAVLQIPQANKPTNSWIVALNVNSRRTIPVLPGFGYQFSRGGTRFYGIVGVPFFVLGGRITKTNDWTYNISYVPLRNVHAQLDYNATRDFTAFVGYDWAERYFARAERTNSKDRTLYLDQRAFVGGLYKITPRVSVDARVGYAFGRQIGEGDTDSNVLDNRIKASDVWYVSLGLNTRF